MTGLHRDRVIPEENKKKRGVSHRKLYAILRKTRWLFIFAFGFILANSYYKIIGTKQIYNGPLRGFCVPFMNCHACPFAVAACPIGILQHFAALRKVPFFLAGYL